MSTPGGAHEEKHYHRNQVQGCCCYLAWELINEPHCMPDPSGGTLQTRIWRLEFEATISDKGEATPTSSVYKSKDEGDVDAKSKVATSEGEKGAKSRCCCSRRGTE
ncbi:hypothetical protein Droror1_Dr00016390 [Drosera rotundifolia]